MPPNLFVERRGRVSRSAPLRPEWTTTETLFYFRCVARLAANITVSTKNPASRIVRKSDVLVVRIGVGRGDQDQLAMRTQLSLRYTLQFLSYTDFLVFVVHREIRQITGVMEIGHRTSDTNQLITIPGAYH